MSENFTLIDCGAVIDKLLETKLESRESINEIKMKLANNDPDEFLKGLSGEDIICLTWIATRAVIGRKRGLFSKFTHPSASDVRTELSKMVYVLKQYHDTLDETFKEMVSSIVEAPTKDQLEAYSAFETTRLAGSDKAVANYMPKANSANIAEWKKVVSGLTLDEMGHVVFPFPDGICRKTMLIAMIFSDELCEAYKTLV